MLPTNNIKCCSVCDCIYKITKPFSDINRRNRRIDRIKERDPEKAAEMTRYGWSGIIGTLFAIAIQAVMYFLTHKIVTEAILELSGESGWENIKQDIFSSLSNLVVAPIAVVTFICAIVGGISGTAVGIIYGRHQKRLNGKTIGKVSTILGLVCLVVLIVGAVLVLNNI